jgi:hypothetical protein
LDVIFFAENNVQNRGFFNLINCFFIFFTGSFQHLLLGKIPEKNQINSNLFE